MSPSWEERGRRREASFFALGSISRRDLGVERLRKGKERQGKRATMKCRRSALALKKGGVGENQKKEGRLEGGKGGRVRGNLLKKEHFELSSEHGHFIIVTITR
ncbi:hypothetical protein Taro_037372 [Colocasia esculenta]|uniref:Uncharacterized protein n=1 Tax=Colocasia esculenta TaxID=4460 RepID=A0A843WG26_COLES|nr:hypothetical protein [Colocasia esculenta]